MPLDSDSDKTARLLTSQDQRQAELLLESYRERLKKMVAARLDPRLAARIDPSDVIQETMLEAMLKLPEYMREQPLPLYPWLRQLAVQRMSRFAQQHIHAQRRSVTREQRHELGISEDSVCQLIDQLIARDASPSLRAMHAEAQHRLRTALDELPELDREVLLMLFIEHLSPGEVAQVLDLTPKAVGMRRLRALRRLSRALSDE
ncbi:MAG: sigma-70 family RNA polymerase sigma factor [Planctomycetales bacterium]|nr:sigma-70 family RNA polymerase sigma factor [Planctomycetales bacterium]